MAYSKIILNGETLMDVTQDTVDSENLLSGETATKNSGAKVTGNIESKSSSDLTVSGATVTAPAGYYATAASKAVATTTHPNPTATIASSTGVVTATHTQTTGYVTSGTTTGTLNLTTQAGKTVTPTESAQTAVASYRWTTGTVSVGAISSTYVGTGVAKKSATDLTASGATVTVPVGYYSSAVTKTIGGGTATTPAKTITTNPTIGVNTSGVITASYNGSSSITPTVTSGYVSQGTAGTVSTTGTATSQLTSQAATTYNTSTADQTIASQRWLVGTQTIKSVTTSNLTAANIKSGTVVKVGDANNASRITQVTGTYAPTISSATVTPTETAQTLNATGVDGYKPVTINAINSTYVGTGVARKSSADLTASGSTVTVPVGYYSSQVTKNVASTTHPNPTAAFVSSTGVFTATHAQTAGYIAAGTTTSTYNLTTQAAQTITPKSTTQYINSYRWLTGSQTIAGDSNLISSNIKSGVSIFGVNGTYAGGTGNLYVYSDGIYDVGQYSQVTNQTFSRFVAGGNDSYWYSNSSIRTIGSGKFMGLRCTEISFPNVTYINQYAFYQCSSLTSASFPSCSLIGASAFAKCTKLNNIYFPLTSTIFAYAFEDCESLISVDLPMLTSIYDQTFKSCYSLTTVNIPVVQYISASVFEHCSSLSNISAPQVMSIGASAFKGCNNLSYIELPKCSVIMGFAFYSLSNLTTVIAPELRIVGYSAFYNCSKLTAMNCSEASTVGTLDYYAFQSCTALSMVNFPYVSQVRSSCFANCTSLTVVSLPRVQSIGADVFNKCYNLISLYLNYVSSVPTLGYYAFSSTPISNYSTVAGRYGSIFVPASLYNDFITHASWSAYSARIVSV